MNKAGAIVGILVLIVAVVMLSGCTSSDDTVAGDDDSVIATSNYDAESGTTYGTTKDGYGYAYNDQATAVSDGEHTYVVDNDDGSVYKYN